MADTINVGLDFYFDDFMASVPARWPPALKWHYFALLNHLHKHGCVEDDDYTIAVKSDLKPVGNYVKTTSKLRQKLCLHPDKPGFLTQARIHQDRVKYLSRREKTRQRVERHRAEKRVTQEPVTHPTPLTPSPTPVTTTPTGPPNGGTVWDHVQWLSVKTGKQERSVRSHLGKLIKIHGEQAVKEAIAGCAREDPVEPMAWITKACKQPRSSADYDTEAVVMAAVEGWNREKAQ